MLSFLPVHRPPRRLFAVPLLAALLLAPGVSVARPAEPPATGTTAAAATGPAALAPATTTAAAPPATAGSPAAAGAPAGDDASQAPLYQVEVVIFRTSYAGNDEDWNSVPPGRGFGTPLASGAQAAQMLRTLAPSDYHLDGVVRGLTRSGSWRPIAHVAWVQTAPPWGSDMGIPLSQVGIDTPGLTGTVYLERARLYLHLGFDVTLNTGAPYRIYEMRNIRPNEKQYFDHPAFGIIAAVYPLKRNTR